MVSIQDLQNLKKGIYHRASWKSCYNGGYEKVSNGVVRIVRYGSINGVSVSGKQNINEKQIVANMVYFNENTGNTLVQLTKTKCPNHKTMVRYLLNGEEISKQDFEEANPPKKSYGDSPIFRIKLENLIYIN